MNQRASALWVRLKANRLAYSISILITLTVGILIGTVISSGVKGQDKKSSSSDAAMLTRTLAADALQPVLPDIEAARTQRGQHQHRIDHQDSPPAPWRSQWRRRCQSL